jgi:ABC-type Mn2+/Zn2+ transport system ATPase subunit
MPVPKRILIIGPNGAGKSTLARHMLTLSFVGRDPFRT